MKKVPYLFTVLFMSGFFCSSSRGLDYYSVDVLNRVSPFGVGLLYGRHHYVEPGVMQTDVNLFGVEGRIQTLAASDVIYLGLEGEYLKGSGVYQGGLQRFDDPDYKESFESTTNETLWQLRAITGIELWPTPLWRIRP